MIGIKKAVEEEKKDVSGEDTKDNVSSSHTSKKRGRGGGAAFFGVKKGVKRSGAKKRMTPGELRVQKDISELDGGTCATAQFPNINDLLNFNVTIAPDEGYWKGYEYRFSFKVPDLYPHEPPKVKCLDRIYHPNIDTKGAVCLNILREDWKPVLDLNSIIYGLIVLFTTPNGDDPLNVEAAKVLREDPDSFSYNVKRSLNGRSVDGVSYPVGRRAGSEPDT